MVWPVTADPLRFDEAMLFFDERVPITSEEFERVGKDARARSFTISGANELAVVQTVFNEIKRAVESGEPIQDFRKRVKAKLKGDWTRATSARLDTIFINTTQKAYGRGRFEQMNDKDVKRTRKFWLYDAVLDSRTTTICEFLNGTVRPADDDFWSGHYPPMHHRCRSGIRSIRQEVADNAVNPKTGTKGVTPEDEKPFPKIPKGFGKTPDQDTAFKPKKENFDPVAWKSYQSKQRTMRTNAAAAERAVPQ